MTMDGLLVIDKPAGPTSHDVVARVRRATGCAKVGHTGTLDPLATGVLPLLVGRATRLAQFFSASDKEYEADIRLGWATDTYDALGKPAGVDPGTAHARAATITGDEWPPSDVLEPVLTRFRGAYLQAPPSFSAKKQDGVRAYELARRGQAVAPRQAPVTVHELVVAACSGHTLRVRIRCSAGFYVRSFAHDLGLAVGPGAHLAALRRTRSGDLDLAMAVPLSSVEDAGRESARFVTPLAKLLAWMPRAVVSPGGAERTRHGNHLRPSDCVEWPQQFDGRVRVFDQAGMLLALAQMHASGLLHPDIVVV